MSMSNSGKWTVVGIVAFVGLLLFIVLNPFIIIQAGERGIVLNWGAVSDVVYDEGLHFRMPVVQSVKVMNVQIQKENVEAGAASRDLQEVQTALAVNFHLDPMTVNKLYQTVGTDFKRRIIDPAVQEAVKAATARYTAEEVITKRQLVREDIKQLLAVRLAKDGIILDEISITDFDFSTSFNAAIEAKVTAEQNALRAKNDLQRVKMEAEQRVAVATAEAEAIKIQAQSISAQGGDAYVNLKAIEKWDGKLPVQMIPGSAVPFINLQSKTHQGE